MLHYRDRTQVLRYSTNHLFRIDVNGQETRADELISQLTERRQMDEDIDLWSSLRHAINGDTAGAPDVVSSSRTDYFRRDPEFQHFFAALLAKAGADDESIEWLNHCVDRAWTNYPLFANRDAMLAGFRHDPRFQLILDRIRPKWDSFGQ